MSMESSPDTTKPSPSDGLVFSIVTPTLNVERTIREAVESVLGQDDGTGRQDWEHLVLDGGSEDGTLQILSEYPHLRVISEKDDGLYDAMNRGARLARGQFLLFLQGDDWLLPGALEVFREAMRTSAGAEPDLLCGGAEAVLEDGSTKWSRSGGRDGEFSLENLVLGEPMVNAKVYGRGFFEALGGFSTEFRLASDREFLLRALARNPVVREVNAVVYRYRWHEGSRTMSEGNQLSTRLNEENTAVCERFLQKGVHSWRGVLRQWHRALTVQAAMVALEEFAVRRWFRAAGRGTRWSPFWILAFATEVLRCLPGFIGRGFRTRSRQWKK